MQSTISQSCKSMYMELYRFSDRCLSMLINNRFDTEDE